MINQNTSNPSHCLVHLLISIAQIFAVQNKMLLFAQLATIQAHFAIDG